MDVIDIIYESGRKKLLEHPLFETFIRLKWEKSWKMFLLLLFGILCHMISLLGFVVFNFGNLQCAKFHAKFWRYLLCAMASFFMLVEGAKFVSYILGLMNASRNMKFASYFSGRKNMIQLRNVFHTVFCPVLEILAVVTMNKELTAIALLLISSIFMLVLTKVPRIGKNVFLSSQVMLTILEFFLSYSVQLFAFALSFHILLPGSAAFG